LLVYYPMILAVTNRNESTHGEITMFYITVKKKLTKTTRFKDNCLIKCRSNALSHPRFRNACL